MDDFKETTLKGHIQLCELRYRQLETKIDEIERRITDVETSVSNLKSQMQTGFSEIKLLIEKANNRRDVQIIASLGTVMVAVIGAAAIYIK